MGRLTSFLGISKPTVKEVDNPSFWDGALDNLDTELLINSIIFGD